MTDSSTPKPFDQEPMFQSWGDEDEVFTIDYGGSKHDVVVRMSWAREATLPQEGGDRGAKQYGKDAAKNLGVSIVRAGRELELDSGWTNSYSPTERWWGLRWSSLLPLTKYSASRTINRVRQYSLRWLNSTSWLRPILENQGRSFGSVSNPKGIRAHYCCQLLLISDDRSLKCESGLRHRPKDGAQELIDMTNQRWRTLPQQNSDNETNRGTERNTTRRSLAREIGIASKMTLGKISSTRTRRHIISRRRY